MRYILPLLLVLGIGPGVRADEPKAYPAPAQVRADFLKLLDRPRVPLDVQVTARKDLPDDLVREELTYASEKRGDSKEERVPTLIVRPQKIESRLPAVIVLHGTGGSKDGMTGLLTDLARRGMIGVAIDARYHGGRSGGAKGATAYNAAIVRAWEAKGAREHPFYFDTVWDLWRLLDYLETRPDVDAGKIGMIGFSMGGIETWLAASVDTRVKATVPAIAVQSFRWSLDHDAWQGRANTIAAAHRQAAKDLGETEVNRKVCRELWNKVIPGILDEFDCPSMLRLFVDRPLLIVGGTRDPNCPYEGAKLAIEAATQAYEKAGARDRLRVLYADVGHTVTPEQQREALAWLQRWLR